MLTLTWTCDQCGAVGRTSALSTGPVSLAEVKLLQNLPASWQFAGNKLLCPIHSLTIWPVFVPEGSPTVIPLEPK